MIQPNAEGDSGDTSHSDQPTTSSSGELIRAGADAPRPQTASSDETLSHDALNGSNIMILWPDRSSRRHDEAARARPSSSRRRRRIMSMAAAAVIAAALGAATGAATSLVVSHRLSQGAPAQDNRAEAETAALRASLAQATSDLAALRADFDRAGRSRTTQIGKLGERLDRMEKVVDEGAAKLARLSENQDKLRAAAAAGDVTGSIAQKTDPKKPPVIEGWTLTKVSDGGAFVDGPGGLYEVYPGDPLPGLGRVDAVRYQDGRWVVVTPKGLIIRR